MVKLAKKYFPTQEDSEQIFLLIRRHWVVYVPLLIITILMALPLVGVVAYWMYNVETMEAQSAAMLIAGTSAYLLFVLGLLLYSFIDYYLDIDIVTDRRIVDISQTGFFHRSISELSLDQVEDVSASENGFFQTMFHFGDVHIQTAGTRPNFLFEAIPHPYRVSRKILDLHDTATKRVEAEAHREEKLPAPDFEVSTSRGIADGSALDEEGAEKLLSDDSSQERLEKPMPKSQSNQQRQRVKQPTASK